MLNKHLFCYVVIVIATLFSMPSFSNEVEIINVKTKQLQDKSWRFDVTLKHDDKGWNHYANKWQVITLDNKILGTRTLYHPHVNEQPFTRSLDGVKIPDDIKKVRIIAQDTVHGLSKNAVELVLSSNKLTHVSLTLSKSKKTDKP